MINERRNPIYLRPGNLFKQFVIERDEEDVLPSGRVVKKRSGDGSEILRGCLAQASDKDRSNHSIQDHVVTHTIVQNGPPMAKRHDKLVLGDRVFYITDVDDCGDLQYATLYYAEERFDVK